MWTRKTRMGRHKNGATALHSAVEAVEAEIVRVLLGDGTEVDTQATDGTPAPYETGYMEIVELLHHYRATK